LNDRECQIGLKYSQDFNRESQTKDEQVFYDKYSILSLLNWARLETEPPFGMDLLQPDYDPNTSSVSTKINIKNMTISATKS